MSRTGPGHSAFFRFAVLLPLLISLVAGLIFVPIYREAVGHIASEVRSAIERESWDLEVEFHENGIDGLIDELDKRTERELDPRTIYLLVDNRDQVLAGNLARWPAAVPRLDHSWAQFEAEDGEHAEGQVFQLFGGRSLLVGRRSPLASFDEHLALQLGVAVIAVFLLSALAAAWFTSRMRKRLAGLAMDAEAIRGGDLGRRLVISPRHDEIDTLADRFNRTFADLERLVDGTRQVSSHLAHDLRRPLQAARQRLEELANSHSLDADAEQTIQASIGEIDTLLATFAALLRLARLQAGGFERSERQIALDQIVADAVEMYQPVAADIGREIHTRVQPTSLRGDRHLWFQLLQNLIENALNHGAGQIDIELDPKQGLSVRDHGPGVSPDQLARLGERFYRADPARSSPGFGIGLALAAAIAEHHHARLSFENANPGLRARVAWDAGS